MTESQFCRVNAIAAATAVGVMTTQQSPRGCAPARAISLHRSGSQRTGPPPPASRRQSRLRWSGWGRGRPALRGPSARRAAGLAREEAAEGTFRGQGGGGCLAVRVVVGRSPQWGRPRRGRVRQRGSRDTTPRPTEQSKPGNSSIKRSKMETPPPVSTVPAGTGILD